MAFTCCEYCRNRTFLSMEMRALMREPLDAKTGAIIIMSNKKTGIETRRVVACFACLESMRKDGKILPDDSEEDISFHYIGPETKQEYEDFINQRKKELGLPLD